MSHKRFNRLIADQIPTIIEHDLGNGRNIMLLGQFREQVGIYHFCLDPAIFHGQAMGFGNGSRTVRAG